MKTQREIVHRIYARELQRAADRKRERERMCVGGASVCVGVKENGTNEKGTGEKREDKHSREKQTKQLDAFVWVFTLFI